MKPYEFAKKYLKPGKYQWNVVKIKKTDGYPHNRMVFDICEYLLKEGIEFTTQAEFKTGYIPDIVCPNHIKPIIEVRNTETEERTNAKKIRIPKELQDKIIYVDATIPFDKKLIL